MAAGYRLDIPDPETAYAAPLDMPLLGRPPSRLRNCQVFTVQYRTDLAAIRRLVPQPLEVTGDTVMVQIGLWGDVPGVCANTYECNVMVPVRLVKPGRTIEGSFSPYFFVDSDRSMLGGREFHGQPKRFAEITLESRDDLHVATVTRNGINAFTGAMPYKPRRATLDDVRSRVDLVTNINLKIIPHIDTTTAIRQLTARDLTDIEVFECWTGPCTAEIRPNPQAPFYRLPVLEHLEGYYWRTEFSLVGGTIIHDYLAAPAEQLPVAAVER